MMMIALAAVLAVAAADTAASAQRSAFSKCLKESVAKAKSAKVGLDAFEAFARTHCAEPEAALRKTVVALDTRNGISRRDANENATLEVDDYLFGTVERYEYEVGSSQPPQAQAKADPPPVQQPQAEAKAEQPPVQPPQ